MTADLEDLMREAVETRKLVADVLLKLAVLADASVQQLKLLRVTVLAFIVLAGGEKILAYLP